MRTSDRGIVLRVVAVAGAMVAWGAAAPAVAQQTPAAAATSWPQFQGNAAHTGSEVGEKSVTRANVGQLGAAWTLALPAQSYGSQVAVAAGMAYAAAGQTVTAFNAASGAQLWQALLPGWVLGTPSVQGSLVVVAAQPNAVSKGFVVALDGLTGARVWTRAVGGLGRDGLLPDAEARSVTTTPRRAYVTLGSGQVDALDIRNGYKVWQSPVITGCVTPPIVSQPSVAGRFVVVSDDHIAVAGLNVADGTLAWKDTFGAGCGGPRTVSWPPAISQATGTVYAGLLNGVVALTLVSGAVVWENTSLTSAFAPPVVTGGALIVSPGNVTGLVALSGSDGTVLWQSSFPGGMTATFGGLAWALRGSSSGGTVRVVALNRFTGHQVFSTASYPDSYQGLPPVVNTGRVYVHLGNEVLCLTLPAPAALGEA